MGRRRLRSFNPIATRATALLWIGAWKLLDVLSTWAGFSASGTNVREVNVLINALAPYVGFTVALVLTVPLLLTVVYVVHHRYPVINEMIALTLPLVVIANTTVLIGALAWLTAVGVLTAVVVGYLAYGWYVQYDPTASWWEKLFAMPEPVLWTPRDVVTDTRDE